MATLLLTAAGTAIGGPIGGAIGAIIGQQVDQNILFRPTGRDGPRLQELAVQTSSYGTQIPRLYGRMRVAGTVIWATDLKESRNREGGGKGRPSTTVYSYSASFAVALSSRAIVDIGRIWADGKILRGAGGDFKTATHFAFHPGREDQPVDGLMASAEASGGSPAYRGVALAVFEEMDLTEYGNRIPSLTFEVVADDGSVSIREILSDISEQRIALQSSAMLEGFAAGGDDRLAALRSLTGSIPLSFSADPGAIDQIDAAARPVDDSPSVVAIDGDFVRAVGVQDVAAPETRNAQVALTPRRLSIRYYDPARDYQAGVQSAWRGGPGRIALVRDFPAAIRSDTARAMAASSLWSDYDERRTLHVSVPIASQSCRPGMLVEFGGLDGVWRVRDCEIGRGFAHLSLTLAGSVKAPVPVESDHGRAVADPDLRAGLTRLALVDLPFAVDAPTAPSDRPRVYAVAAGDAGWRNAQLFASGPDGTAGDYIGRIPAPTVMGVALTPPGPANPALIDRVNHVDVALHNAAMTLNHADDSQLLAGHNIALVGREIIQFSSAWPLGPGQFRLSRLIRGLGGTEAEILRHGEDTDFVLLDAGSMLEIGAALPAPFSPATVFAVGRDDAVPVAATIAAPGRALMPWSPVHPVWKVSDDGDLEIGWTRRSRAGTIWPDQVEVPLAEEGEKYRIIVSGIGEPGAALSLESAVPEVVVPAAQIQAFLASDISCLSVGVHQVGAYGLSDALTFELPL